MGSLNEARELSKKKIEKLRLTISNKINEDNVCIYACGSLGRFEITEKSDLDLFFILMDDAGEERTFSRLSKYVFFSKMYEINQELGFDDPSKGGFYWNFITEKKLLDIGSREEDYNNSFTARMLLILEGKALSKKETFVTLKRRVINKYFEDYPDHREPFYPLFLMNDIWRYWYTLTLNYEHRKDPGGEHDKNDKNYWKRLKLKFARFFTCMSMIMCLFKEDLTEDDVLNFSDLTPFERIEYLQNNIPEIAEGDYLNKITKKYEWFLDLRKNDSTWWKEKNNKDIAFTNADEFHTLLKNMLSVVASTNPDLAEKMDLIIIRR